MDFKFCKKKLTGYLVKLNIYYLIVKIDFKLNYT